MAATYVKLDTGSWGVRVDFKACEGMSIDVAKRDGSVSRARLAGWFNPGPAFLSSRSKKRTPAHTMPWMSQMHLGLTPASSAENMGMNSSWRSISMGSKAVSAPPAPSLLLQTAASAKTKSPELPPRAFPACSAANCHQRTLNHLHGGKRFPNNNYF